MERKIDEIFTYNGKIYQVVKSIVCTHCAFRGKLCGEPFAGNCMPSSRSDKTGVIFKEINNMEIKNNQLTINIPEGIEIDLKNSDLAKGIVKFKKKDIIYDDILQAYATDFGGIRVPNHCIDRILAISQLINIAKYYNGDWKPNWRSLMESKYYIYYSTRSNIYGVTNTSSTKYINIYFRLYKDAKAVIDNPNFRDILDKIYKN